MSCGSIVQGSAIECDNIPAGGTRARAIFINYDDIASYTQVGGRVTSIALVGGSQAHEFTGFRNDMLKSEEVVSDGGIGISQFRHLCGIKIYERTQEQKNNIERIAKGRFVVIMENRGKDEDAIEVLGIGSGLEIVAGSIRNAYENGGHFVINLATPDGEFEPKLPQSLGSSYANGLDLIDALLAGETEQLLTLRVNNIGGAGAQTDFPVRLVLNSSNFDFQATDGQDIRFYADVNKTTPLSFWREHWDAANESATFWIKMPTLPNNASTNIYMNFGAGDDSDASDGSAVFTVFDDFEGGAVRQQLIGTDAGFATVFVPELRRLYSFGQDQQSSIGANIIQWHNIDTGEAGFVWPGLDTPVNAPGVCYHPVNKKIYVYGGRATEDGTRVDDIQVFDPFTETFDTLTETLPVAMNSVEAVYHPASGNVFLFGGRVSGGERDQIIIHNIGAGTLTTTTAELPVPAYSVGGIYCPADGLIYLFGGTIDDGTDNLDTILSYNPATPNTNPVDTGETLADVAENQHGCWVESKSAIYLFGGFKYKPSNTYTDIIQKYVPSTNTCTTLSATMPRPDDDHRAFYDSVTDRVYISPCIHSDEVTDNAFHNKVVINVFDPNTETIAAEPALRTGPPSGWTSEGTVTDRVPYHVGSYMVLDDDADDKIIRAQKLLASNLSAGVWMAEAKVDLATPQGGQGNAQFALVETSSVITQIRMKATGGWEVGASGGALTDVAGFATGWQIIGTLVDFDNARQYGLVDRGNRTSALTFRNSLSSAVNRIWINTTNTPKEKLVFDWVIIRKAALNEPTVTVL